MRAQPFQFIFPHLRDVVPRQRRTSEHRWIYMSTLKLFEHEGLCHGTEKKMAGNFPSLFSDHKDARISVKIRAIRVIRVLFHYFHFLQRHARISALTANIAGRNGVSFTGVDCKVPVDVDVAFGLDAAPVYCSSRM
jgi:hypothetical protein